MIRTEGIEVAAIPRIGHQEAMRLAVAENRAFGDLLRSLRPDDLPRPTDCDRWDVQALVAHVVGSAAAQASPREFVRQVRKGRLIVAEIGGEFWWDGMNEVQVRERAGRSVTELASEWDDASARAVRSRKRLPRSIAALPLLNLPAPVGRQPIRYLFDMGFTRDVWMHRLDLARAIGLPPDLRAAHDGRIVADVVAEWAQTHGEPFTLVLHGPAGGTYRSGPGGDLLEVEVTEFCRYLTGRVSADGLLAHPLPL